MDLAKREFIREGYKKFLREQTHSIIKIVIWLGSLFYVIFGVIDFAIGGYDMIPWRLLGLSPLLINALLVSRDVFYKRPELIIPLHTASILLFFIHELGLLYVYWGIDERMNTLSIIAFIIAVTISLIAAGGALKFLPYIHIATCLGAGLVLWHKNSFQDNWELFSINMLFLLAGTTSFAFIYENMRFRSFEVRHELQAQKLNMIQKENLMQISQLREKAAHLELQALRTQINPHFIFNTLNAIQSCALTNKKKFLDSMDEFSRLLRMVLAYSDKQQIRLKDEIQVLSDYLSLQSLCYPDRFTWSIEYPETLDLTHIQLPPMLLQPFVENAVKHGLLNQNEPGELILSFSKEKGRLLCSVKDNGIGMAAAKSIQERKGENPDGSTKRRSLGISVIRERLAILAEQSQKEFELLIHDHSEQEHTKGVEVHLYIPV